MAVLMGAGAFFWHTPSLALIAVFVFFAGRQELMALRYREQMRGAEPLWALPGDRDPTEAAPAPEYGGFTGFRWNVPARAWEVWRNGRVVAVCRVDAD